MRFWGTVGTLLVATIAGAASSAYVAHHTGSDAQNTETAYERVMRTNTLRCAYWVSPPSTLVDPQTSKVEGFVVDVVEEMAARLSLKVKWVEEVTFGTQLAGLETNRYDAACTGGFITAARSRNAEWTMPFVYNGFVGVVRADDNRFSDDIGRANAADITITAMDGDVTTEIAKNHFPQSKKLPIAQNASYTDAYMNVIGHKADLLFDEPGRVATYIKNNGNKVKIIAPNKPILVSAWSIPVKVGEHKLAGMLSGALTEMLYDGSIERLSKPYEDTKGYYFFTPSVRQRQ
ncbi:MAG: transporter substrate-binding domain-containing protein [Alphaproteobacteria bacterium]|nr:transporter substrate-binding domain-containing protein [Alphaproteobacteria bacterium]